MATHMHIPLYTALVLTAHAFAASGSEPVMPAIPSLSRLCFNTVVRENIPCQSLRAQIALYDEAQKIAYEREQLLADITISDAPTFRRFGENRLHELSERVEKCNTQKLETLFQDEASGLKKYCARLFVNRYSFTKNVCVLAFITKTLCTGIIGACVEKDSYLGLPCACYSLCSMCSLYMHLAHHLNPLENFILTKLYESGNAHRILRYLCADDTVERYRQPPQPMIMDEFEDEPTHEKTD